MSQSEHVDQIYAALAQAQGMMKNPAFDAINPHFKNRYATLAAVVDSTRDAMSKNGIAVTHTNDIEGEQEFLITTLGHKSGQWIRSCRRVPQGLKAQEYGAWLTYNRRYALLSLAGISADEDDDGNIAQAAGNGARQKSIAEKWGTVAADITEHEVAYNEQGEPVDNIPHGDPHIEKLRTMSARKEHEELQKEMLMCSNLTQLRKWANLSQTRDRVQSLPDINQARLRDLFEGKKKELAVAEVTHG